MFRNSIHIMQVDVFPSIIGFVLTFSLFALIFSLTGLLVKKRSTISGLFFFLLISSICTSLLGTSNGETVDTSIIDNIRALSPENNIGPSLVTVIETLSVVSLNIHIWFLNMIMAITQNNADFYNFFNTPVFLVAVYAILFILCFFLFKRKKKHQRIYSDYDL